MQSPIEDQKPARQPPALNAPGVVLWLIGVTVVMHVFLHYDPTGWSRSVQVYVEFNPAHLQFFDEYPFLVGIRWIGHAFAHIDLTHLLVNCGFLLAFGTPVARQIPAYSFLLLYALGAVGGAAFSLITYAGQDAILLGASGAVSALTGALSRMVFLRRGAEFIPYPFSDRKFGLIFIGVFFAANLLFFIVPGPGGLSVSGESHIGGFLTGFVLSLILPWHRRGQRHAGEDGRYSQ